MSKLRDVVTRMAKMQETIGSLESVRYTCSRDKDANLIVAFDDGYTIQLPSIPFRPYQLALQQKLFVDGCKRHLIQRPRRSGKELESWSLLIQSAITTPGLYLMVYPTNVRARKILLEGAVFINNKSIPFIDMIPKRLLQSVNAVDMTIKLKNGSVLWLVGSDIDPDKLRGTNPLGIIFAEFAFQDPRVLYTMLPVLRQNDGWLICQSTYDGINHFYQMMQSNANDPLWNCVSDSIENLVDEAGNRYITDAMIDEDIKAGMPMYLVQQEYYGKVQLNQETRFFAHAMNYLYQNSKIIKNLIYPNENLYTAWDLGVNDLTCITFFQIKYCDGKPWPAVVGYHENNNQDLLYYVNECRAFAARYNLSIKTHFIPHDGKAQKVLSINNETTLLQMQKLGEPTMIVERPTDKRAAIEAMRRKLHMTTFNAENTQRLLDCLSNYSKEFDAKLGTYKDKPIHSWASHGVDSYQSMTLALDRDMLYSMPTDVVYIGAKDGWN